ncbi:MAG: TRAP transporter large permease subunit, partial [Desulfobacterales bacterium]|nr:TRAP transporter large permease subunit [Desulfobacterales bacterium]
LLLIVGCVMDLTPALLILAPMLLPIAAKYGLDPVYFGVVMIVNLCVAHHAAGGQHPFRGVRHLEDLGGRYFPGHLAQRHHRGHRPVHRDLHSMDGHGARESDPQMKAAGDGRFHHPRDEKKDLHYDPERR